MSTPGANRPERRLVLASNNAGKLAELQALLAPLGFTLVTQGSLGIDETDEPHGTFIENGLRKARHAARASGLPALADDSGLCVPALGGLPGVASAHYADAVAPQDGEGREGLRRRQDAANNAKLQHALQALGPPASRAAYFVCTLVALRSADDPEPVIAQGRWLGRITDAARGTRGFGYDPWLEVGPGQRTVAELEAADKNARSHRALAARAMVAMLPSAWGMHVPEGGAGPGA